MPWWSNLWSWGAAFSKSAFRIDKFDGIYKLSASITLITLSIVRAAKWASSTHKSICKELSTNWTVHLVNYFLISISSFFECFEDILCNFCLFRSWSSTKELGVTVEPIIYLLVNFMVFCANLLRRHIFFNSFCLCGCSILISTAYKNSIVAHETTVSGKNISWKDASNNVP